MYNIVIAIPIYKEILTDFEQISFLQCLRVLQNHNFSIFTPKSLNTLFYEKILKLYNLKFNIERFNDDFFRSIKGYNSLMLNPIFYERYLIYDYIFIYQLDSYIFKDELEKWCNSGYDFIGAPWITLRKGGPKFIGVGNGGFSLRNTKKILGFLDSKTICMNTKGFMKIYANYSFLKKLSRLPKVVLSKFGYKNNKVYYLTSNEILEDYVFGIVANHSKKKFHIPEAKDALTFSFDIYPEILFELNNKNLPMGCHGWYKSEDNLEFWRKYINTSI